jgi:protein-S-isoprenylcysteine O-methyltransferase Ste14
MLLRIAALMTPTLAQTTLTLQSPVFELKGKWNTIDLSAWISGLSFATGLWLAGLDQVETAIVTGALPAVVLAAGIAAFFMCSLYLQRKMRLSLASNTFGSPKRLTTTGVFGLTRNPIYVAFLIPLASISAFSLLAAIAATQLYVLLMTITVIRKEERDLLETFGQSYADYVRHAPRWLM